ncbi:MULTISPECIES: hypothetical protein [Streptomyces]|uniref:Uncharacterized protein n=1 Tax=Streptomyces sp. CMC78 TaxID=3231512 RepID=A0AB33KNT8_9ACTN|nr:hypothetical protein [Streptomyces sp. ID01-9D]MDX5572378.1 hypothetical protein [Streptomyces sp. ID01-9D]
MTTERPPEIAHFVDREDEAAQVFAGLEEWTALNRAFPVVLWAPPDWAERSSPTGSPVPGTPGPEGGC